MRGKAKHTLTQASAAALACFAGAAACGAEALRTHLWFASLGPICGLERPGMFLLHCPACPAALAFLAAGTVFAAMARPFPARATVR